MFSKLSPFPINREKYKTIDEKKTNKIKYKEYSAVLNSLQFAEQLVKANKDLQERKSGDKTINSNPLKID